MSTFVYCLLVALGLVIALLVVRMLFVASGIHYWARIGSVEAICDLLAKDPDLVNSADTGGETPAHHAAKRGQKEALEALLDHGADLNSVTEDGATILHYAAGWGDSATVKLLLERSAEVDPKDRFGYTPLMIAQAAEKKEIADVLIAAGADTNARPAVLRMDGGELGSLVSDDDPLMMRSIEQAQQTLPLMRDLFKQFPSATAVKFAFETDSGEIEHLWAELLELGDDMARVHVKTPPLWHSGKFANKRDIHLQAIEDWQVGLPDGTIRGGFGFLVVFHRTLEQTGKLPKEFVEMKDRFVDHDLASLLEATGE